ncbi:hypothetical protein [Sinorhizobium alkalisoli]|uniref:hypothetical protein n=1 Tax=Sinorhizobium alkalisoli TaxID=1752398 RepID=UPI00124F73BC|nr:hypothetical protein [Sinorhizobium alkalisoli]QFI69934.1 Translation initiation factor 2 [Sinorhizobium alkalisoli]
MPRQGKTQQHQPDLTKSTGTETRRERQKARPNSEELTEPKEVWKESEATPQPIPKPKSEIGRKRVADAGDLQDGEPSPYETEVQADRVAKQTDRNRPTTTKRR